MRLPTMKIGSLIYSSRNSATGDLEVGLETKKGLIAGQGNQLSEKVEGSERWGYRAAFPSFAGRIYWLPAACLSPVIEVRLREGLSKDLTSKAI